MQCPQSKDKGVKRWKKRFGNSVKLVTADRQLQVIQYIRDGTGEF